MPPVKRDTAAVRSARNRDASDYLRIGFRGRCRLRGSDVGESRITSEAAAEAGDGCRAFRRECDAARPSTLSARLVWCPVVRNAALAGSGRGRGNDRRDVARMPPLGPDPSSDPFGVKVATKTY